MRRFLTPLGALLAVVTVSSLSSCSTFEQRDVAASVNGHEITFEQLGTLADDSTSATVLRKQLTTWIEAASQAEGDADLTSIEGVEAARVASNLRISESVRGSAQENYELGIDGAEYFCPLALPLAATDDADAIRDELLDGRDFADAVQEYSINESLKTTGGKIVDEAGTNCVAAAVFAQGLETFLPAIIEASPVVGEPTIVTYGDESAPGTFILLLRAYDTLDGADLAAVEHTAIAEVLAQLYASADVYVNPRLGRWDASTNTVVEG